jgi:excisionase family DNA binding protein
VIDRLLTTREVADRLGVTPETVLRWIDRRGLPVVRLTSRALRYDRAALDAWIAERTTAALRRESANSPDQRRRGEATLSAPTVPLRRGVDEKE